MILKSNATRLFLIYKYRNKRSKKRVRCLRLKLYIVSARYVKRRLAFPIKLQENYGIPNLSVTELSSTHLKQIVVENVNVKCISPQLLASFLITFRTFNIVAENVGPVESGKERCLKSEFGLF